MLSNLNLIGVFVTHFVIGHRLSNLHYQVIQRTSVGLSDFLTYSHSCLPEVSTVMWPWQHLGPRSRVEALWANKTGV